MSKTFASLLAFISTILVAFAMLSGNIPLSIGAGMVALAVYFKIDSILFHDYETKRLKRIKNQVEQMKARGQR